MRDSYSWIPHNAYLLLLAMHLACDKFLYVHDTPENTGFLASSNVASSFRACSFRSRAIDPVRLLWGDISRRANAIRGIDKTQSKETTVARLRLVLKL